MPQSKEYFLYVSCAGMQKTQILTHVEVYKFAGRAMSARGEINPVAA